MRVWQVGSISPVGKTSPQSPGRAPHHGVRGWVQEGSLRETESRSERDHTGFSEREGTSTGPEPVSTGARRHADHARTVTNTETVEEALALALRGRIDEALVLLGEGDASREGAVPPAVPDVSGALALARILQHRGADSDRERAGRILSALLTRNGETDWRSPLELARLAREEGRHEDAASLLQQVLKAFRARSEGSTEGDGPDPHLASMIARDVQRLQAAMRHGESGASASPGSGDRK